MISDRFPEVYTSSDVPEDCIMANYSKKTIHTRMEEGNSMDSDLVQVLKDYDDVIGDELRPVKILPKDMIIELKDRSCQVLLSIIRK